MEKAAPSSAAFLLVDRKLVGWAKRKRAHLSCTGACEGGHGASAPLPTLRQLLPSLQYDLAARLAALEQRMRALEVGGIDRAKGLVECRAQHALVDEVGDV